MKPKAPNEHEDGLLEYLEDIIGTSKYKEPIEETLVEVDKLNEERSEKLNRLRVVERDKSGLEEKKKEAEAWLRNKVSQDLLSPAPCSDLRRLPLSRMSSYVPKTSCTSGLCTAMCDRRVSYSKLT